MERIAIMTFPNSPSFGASLQMNALYTAIRELGYDVEVINYMNMFMKEKKHISKSSSSYRFSLRRIVAKSLYYPQTKVFQDFEKQIAKYPKKVLHTQTELLQIAKRYSHVVVGSDQVWNPNITGFDTSYLLDFCAQNTKRIAYAPSFGVNSLEEKYTDTFKRELLSFDALSAREVRGQEIIHELMGKKCPLVLDPSMLLTKGEWEKRIARKGRSSKGYIVRFVFNRDQKTDDFIAELSKRKGLPIYEIGGHMLTNIRNREKQYSGPIGPSEWLGLIHDAECVVTDSFHGAAFSIIFEKELYVSLASSTNARLITLLDNVKLNHRVIGVTNMNDNEKIDYAAVNERLAEKREHSMAYLRESLTDGRKMMVTKKDKKSCCGCGACVAICRSGALALRADEEGFLYPVLDEEKCTGCGLCDKACVFNKKVEHNESQKYYIAQHKSEAVCADSTSGGMYTAISDAILEQNGIVYAPDFAEDHMIVHKRIVTKEERNHSRGSKYVQSLPNDYHKKLMADLKEGKLVAFFGTPCQAAGVLACVPKQWQGSLYCIDIICNGVGSPMVWKQYAAHMEMKAHSELDKYVFRPKSHGYLTTSEMAVFADGKTKELTCICDKYNPLYHDGLITRPSCSNCQYASLDRVSNITIGDFSKSQDVPEKLNRGHGLSTVLVNDSKGAQLMSLCEERLTLWQCDAGTVSQIRLQRCAEENPKRKAFLQSVREKGLRYASSHRYSNATRLKMRVASLIRRGKK